MHRWILVALAVFACRREEPRKTVDDPLRECVADAIVRDASAGTPATRIGDALMLAKDVTTPEHAQDLARAVAVHVERAGMKPLPVLLAAISTWQAMLGDVTGAVTLARRAVAMPAEGKDRESVVQDAALVIAWSGDVRGALELAKGNTLALLNAAQGAARAGHRDEAARVIAEHRAEATSDVTRAMVIESYGLVRDVAAARAAIDGLTDPSMKAYAHAIMGRALVDAKDPKAIEALTASARDVMQLVTQAASDDVRELELTSLIEIAMRMDDAGNSAAAHDLRTQIHGAILEGPSHGRLVSYLASAAELAGDRTEANKLLDEAGREALAIQRVHIAAARDDFPKALDLYAKVTDERALGATSIWGFFVQRPHDAELVGKVKSALCATPP